VNHNSKAWEVLLSLDADVVLLQEATAKGRPMKGDARVIVPPSDDWKVQGANGPAATAIVVLNSAIKFSEVPIRKNAEKSAGGLAASYPGQFAIIELPLGPDMLNLVSLYGVIEHELADSAMHRAISDLTPMMTKHAPVLVAGDFNIFRGHALKSVKRSLERYKSVFDRFEALGYECLGPSSSSGALADCSCGDAKACDHVATLRWRNDLKTPFQVDYAFGNAALQRHFVSCNALDDEKYWAVSDHAPIETVLVPSSENLDALENHLTSIAESPLRPTA